ncbi:CRP-like cAMP-binding protein [Natranaerovirga hydrolytica]|uniref:CRP-like cAMP-binding protein n=1 Tax=Natranaerovirga hydrolytica TaxID=680378 RepID=A0A4R1MX50_9FIRM|nr:Crp/Fnr family transcriptional regulator [Natranaerovirga hydrolytica]TCK97827.1 CRP-like cAMP-binding protein [Natranaerovirga hydrolytica]
MDHLINSLKDFSFFKELNDKELMEALNIASYELKSYTNDEIIAFEGSPCTQLGLIFHGNINISKIYPSGRTVSITTLTKGNVFGEVILFSNHSIYPSTVIASTDCSVLFFEKNKFLFMCDHFPKVYKTLLQAFSDRILLLNQKITNLSLKSIRQKIIHYLFQCYKVQQSKYIDLHLNRSEWADLIGVPRPSLSRELINMKEDGLIDFDKKTIQLLDLTILEDALFK